MNQDLFNRYNALVNFLGETLGPDYEILLYDLEKENRIISAYNSHISGHKIGDTVSENDLSILKGATSDTLINYPGWTKGLSYLRSSSMFIKDSDNNIVGLLTISFDDSRFVDLHDRILSVAHPITFIKEHTYHTLQEINKFDVSNQTFDSTHNTPEQSTNIENMLLTIYRAASRKVNLPSDRLTPDERITMIGALEEYGFFRLKGAVPFAAERLRCSNASIYRYLSEVKNKK